MSFLAVTLNRTNSNYSENFFKKRRMRILSARIFSKFFGGKIEKISTAF